MSYNPYDHYATDDFLDLHDSPCDFRNPGGRSALRKGKRLFACPTCKRENVLSQADKNRGYQCDSCADAAEGIGFYGEY